jgi:uncharacterized protein (TIGR02996 family)
MLLRALMSPDGACSSPVEKAFLGAIRDRPGDEAAWNAFSDWLQDEGKHPVGLHLLQRALSRVGVYRDPDFRDSDNDPNPWELSWGDLAEAGTRAQPLSQRLDSHPEMAHTLVRVDEHLAQLCFRANYWEAVGRGIHHQWILFDDLWASAHPDLANAILRYVQRWDVLSSSRTDRDRA